MTSQVTQIETQSKTSFLTAVLRADGIVALIPSLLLVLASRPVAELIELETPAALIIVGLVLTGYALMLLFYAGREPANRRVAQIAVVLNFLWVADSYAGLLLGWFPVNTAGKWAIALVAEVAFVFGILELYALRRLNKETA
jgi:hypothetical protein